MLASLPSLQSPPAQSPRKENSTSDSEKGEGFSAHLDEKSTRTSDTERSDSSEATEVETQPSNSETAGGGDGETSTAEEASTDADMGEIAAKSEPENLDPRKILSELRFTQLVKSEEMAIAKSTGIDGISLPSPELGNDETMLMASSEGADDLSIINTKLLAATQNLNGSEKLTFNAASPIAAMGSGLVKDPKPIIAKNTKPGAALAPHLQAPIAGVSNAGAQNQTIQPEVAIQPNIALSQERGAAGDADLEKTLRSIELKTPSVSVDPSPQKLSAEGNVPSLSQPSQTLVRAIQENSNWTKVLSSSSVQLEQTSKLDGTVLQKLDIHLNLTALGKLDVKLRLQQGELQVQIRTDSEQAYKMLSVDQDVLANTIKGLGYKVDTIAISGPRSDGGFQMNSNSQSEGQQHSTEQHYQNEKSGQRADREFMPMKDADNETQNPSSVIEHSAADIDVI